jgi:HK97 family phage major capsid protein/HK97 family phage prohead protease
MNQRAYSTLEIKAATEDGGKRRFSGIASTPETDRMGDIVEPKGAEFKLPLPLLWQHDSRNPIGWITKARVTDSGIEVEGEVASMNDDPDSDLAKALKSYWQYIKSGLVRGLSIGFNAKETARIEGTYGYRIMKWAWLELSAVTIPANEQATILAIKSADLALQAASGHRQLHDGRASALPPGVPGATKNAASRGTQTPSGKGPTMKTAYQELAEFREQRTTKTARMEELQTLAKSAERRMTQDEAQEFDALLAEVDAIDDQIRAKSLEALNGAAARPVNGDNSKAAGESRGPMGFVRKTDPDDKFKGQSYIRAAIAKAAAFIAMKQGSYVSPIDIAQHRWGKTHPNLINWIKAGVAGAGTGSGEWGAELAQSDTRYTGDFIEFLYSMTVFDRLPLRSVPARVHIKGQDGAATGYWVGESKSIPVTKADASDVELTPLKVGAIAVSSKELIQDSQPSAEQWIRDCIAEASAQRVDTTFLGSAAAVAGVSPAGLLNGLTPLVPSGADAAAVRADLMSLYAPFLAAKNASGLVQVMTPSMAKALSLLVNALGQPEFVGLNASGGTLLGDQVYTGDNVAGGDWILMKPSDIWKIGDSGIEISMTDTATLEQDDAPTGASDTPAAATANLVNLWQTESVGFKVVRRINYQKRRSGAVVVLSNAEYGGVAS